MKAHLADQASFYLLGSTVYHHSWAKVIFNIKLTISRGINSVPWVNVVLSTVKTITLPVSALKKNSARGVPWLSSG